MEPTWIEAAINGRWGPDRQPGSPTTVSECVEQGIACVEAGAAILHVHSYVDGEEVDDVETYAAIVEGIREEVDAIVYPTRPSAGIEVDATIPAADRYETTDELARRGLLEWGVVDPGTLNMTTYETVANDETGDLFLNPESHLREGLEVLSRHGAHPAYAIYEPGFVRLGAALADRYPEVGQPIYRFMFSDAFTFNFPPEPYALDGLVRLLEDEAGDAPWMVSGLEVDVTPLLQRSVEKGGHVRVGLEDAPLGTSRTNVEWVAHAREQVEAAGGRPATAAEVRDALA